MATSLEKLHTDTLLEIEKLYIEYDMGEVPEERLLKRAAKILTATDFTAAIEVSKSVIAATQIHGILNGAKRTPEWYERQARGCASRAKTFRSKGEEEKAEEQLKYKAKYEKLAAELRETK